MSCDLIHALKVKHMNTLMHRHPHILTQAPSTTSRRHRRTIYAKSRSASMFFPLRVFGNIKTFTVDFEIPVLDIMIQMDIRGKEKHLM